MLDYELKLNELVIPGLYVFLTVFLIWRANGLQNILRFLLRFYKISYTDKKMTELDDKWFNVQLFRFTTGINISTIENARKIQEKLNNGVLKPSTFIFTSGWGDITVVKPWWRVIINYIGALSLIAVGTFAWYQQMPLVYDYTKVEYRDLSYYISNEKVIMNPISTPPDLSEGRSKKDCATALSSGLIPPGSLFEIACNRLLDESDLSKNRLNGEIEKSSSIKRNLTILYYLYCTLGAMVAFTLTRFVYASYVVRKAIGSR